ncbi:Protein TANC1 [Fusarium oxysporum f. sp. albedinis]|nr:hypothetical protein HZ326_22354 [Fusarium oxysporum f. sp. albedinis]KAJ0135078.1 Protein TANC1 [Fusarium oxysporum f. sp. albedinis]
MLLLTYYWKSSKICSQLLLSRSGASIWLSCSDPFPAGAGWLWLSTSLAVVLCSVTCRTNAESARLPGATTALIPWLEACLVRRGLRLQFYRLIDPLDVSPQQVSPECVCFADLGKVSSTISWDQATALLMGLARGSHPVFNCRTHSSELRLCLCPLG